MKRKMNFVLACLLMMVMLSACGAKEVVEDTTAVSDKEVETTSPENTEETQVTEETAEPVETEVVEVVEETVGETVEETEEGGMVDVILGKDIQVNDNKIKRCVCSITNFPETHILLPSDSFAATSTEVHNNGIEYEVYVPDLDKTVFFKIYLLGDLDDYCAARHEDTVEYGRYLIDYNWCQFAVKDTNTQIAFVVLFYSDSKNASEMHDTIEQLTDANIEYLKEQLPQWDENFVGETVTDTEEPEISEEPIYSDFEEIGPLVFTKDSGDMEMVVNNFMTEGINMTASDSKGNAVYNFPLYPAGENYYQVLDGDSVAIDVIIEDGKLICDVLGEKYTELDGDYTLVE